MPSQLSQLGKGALVEYMGTVFSVLNTGRIDTTPRIPMEFKRFDDETIIQVHWNDFIRDGKIITCAPTVNDPLAADEPVMPPLSEEEDATATKRLEMVTTVEDYKKAAQLGLLKEFIEDYRDYFAENTDITALTQEKVIEAIAWKKNVSPRNIHRFLKTYRYAVRKGNDPKRALAGRAGKGYLERKDSYLLEINDPRKPSEVIARIYVQFDEQRKIFKKEIEETYLNHFAITKTIVADNIIAACVGNKPPLKAPNRSTIYKIIAKIDEDKATRIKGSEKDNEPYEEVDIGITKKAKYPLHIVAIDSTELDVDVIDKSTGEVIGRPNMTLAIDLFSRAIVGIYISFDPPSQETTLKTLMNCLFIKNAKVKYGTKNEWEVYGRPYYIYVDNGKAFDNENLRRQAGVIGCKVMFRPRRTPEYCATIERVLGTFNTQLFHNMAGTRKSNPSQLGDMKPEIYACYSLEQVERLAVKYIVDVYHFQGHTGLPSEAHTPMARYHQGIQATGFPSYIQPEDEERFRLEMMLQDKRAYRRTGIEFGAVRYQSPLLSDIINPKVELPIKYDKDDISQIRLLHPKTNELVIIPAVEPPAADIAGWNRFYYDWVREKLRKEGKIREGEIPGHDTLMEARYEINKELKEGWKKGRRSIIKAATRAKQHSDDVVVAPKTEEQGMKELAELIKKSVSMEKSAGGKAL